MRRLIVRLAETAPSPVAKAIYDAVIAVELVLERLADSLSRRRTARADDIRDVTAVIKTFERPKVARRLIRSIRGFYPTLPILLVDDSREPLALKGVETLALPYDSGLAVGRNEALRRVQTKYVLILDDDFVFYRETDVVGALRLMEQHQFIDIMGGEVVDLPFYRKRLFSHEPVYATEEKSTLPPGTTIDRLSVCDQVANFLFARTDRLEVVGWDPQFKLLEHTDFFTRAKGVLTTVLDPDLKVLHARTPFDGAYIAKRNRDDEFEALLRRKWGSSIAQVVRDLAREEASIRSPETPSDDERGKHEA